MHKPVLLSASVMALSVQPQGRYIDGTLGMGGHAQAVLDRLNSEGRLLGLDMDAGSLEKAKANLCGYGTKFIPYCSNFRHLNPVMNDVGWEHADGMFFDLGVSSWQLDNADRGLAFSHESALDMRLDPTLPKTALDVLLTIEEEKLVAVLKECGEPAKARALARTLTAEATAGGLKTTGDLARLCERLLPRRGKSHPATRVFMALRMLVNDEMGALNDLLSSAPLRLNRGGRLVVITFHSTEDRLVKQAFRQWVEQSNGDMRFDLPIKKAIAPTEQEQRENPRSRSAKLRALRRVA